MNVGLDQDKFLIQVSNSLSFVKSCTCWKKNNEHTQLGAFFHPFIRGQATSLPQILDGAMPYPKSDLATWELKQVRVFSAQSNVKFKHEKQGREPWIVLKCEGYEWGISIDSAKEELRKDWEKSGRLRNLSLWFQQFHHIATFKILQRRHHDIHGIVEVIWIPQYILIH